MDVLECGTAAEALRFRSPLDVAWFPSHPLSFFDVTL
jgi:hypothetical protein